jgi:hypothetical protein
MTTLNFIPKDARLCNNTYIVNVTPELARKWLNINNFNRPKNAESVAKYVRQIRDGHWRLTHQGVALTQNGFLLDGQHRLFALIECGVTLPMRVCFNEPIENYEVIDCGRNRSNLDVARMSLKDSTITSLHMQTLRAMLAGRLCRTANRWTSIELNEYYLKYRDTINFVVNQFQHCKNKQINDSTVRGVIARAHVNHIATESLEYFCSLLINGGEHPSRAAIDVFVHCLKVWNDRRENTKREIYRRCELTLKAFLTNTTEVNFDNVTIELFPLPSELR